MAKVSLTKVTPLKAGEIKEVNIQDEIVQVRQYLPVDEKIALTERVLTRAFDETNYYSIYRLTLYTEIEIIKTYTNFNFTEKQLENIPKLYDLLVLNNIIKIIEDNIPEKELIGLKEKINNEAEHLEKYLNSFAGVMKTITTDYSNTQINVEKIVDDLKNTEGLSTIKDILDKIG